MHLNTHTHTHTHTQRQYNTIHTVWPEYFEGYNFWALADFSLNESFYDLILEVVHLDISIITLTMPHGIGRNVAAS